MRRAAASAHGRRPSRRGSMSKRAAATSRSERAGFAEARAGMCRAWLRDAVQGVWPRRAQIGQSAHRHETRQSERRLSALRAGGPEVAGAGNLRSRLAATGQNMHGGSAPPAAASGAASAHNGVDGGRLAVAQMCIKFLETLMHIEATLMHIGATPHDRLCGLRSVPGSESGSFALASGIRWQ
jgi:hypothetical protein